MHTGPFVEIETVNLNGSTYADFVNLADVVNVGQAMGQPAGGGPPQVVIGMSVIYLRTGTTLPIREDRRALMARFNAALRESTDNPSISLDKLRAIV